MSFWQATMIRSIKLSKTYFIFGLVMSIFGTFVSNMISIIPENLITLENASIDLINSIPLSSISLISLSVVIFSTPVVMLFVFDKNTGVLEYLLSTGLDQLDIYKSYVKASLSLAIFLLLFSNILNISIGIYLGTSLSMLTYMVVLTCTMGISGALLTTSAMMVFSSLQKSTMGANQPLGMMIGVIPMIPALMVPLLLPSYAMIIVIMIAAITSLFSLGLLLLSSRLIPREKLLP